MPYKSSRVISHDSQEFIMGSCLCAILRIRKENQGEFPGQKPCYFSLKRYRKKKKVYFYLCLVYNYPNAPLLLNFSLLQNGSFFSALSFQGKFITKPGFILHRVHRYFF